MTNEDNYQITLREERRPAAVVAASYGRDVVRMLQSPEKFESFIGLYARIAFHYAALTN